MATVSSVTEITSNAKDRLISAINEDLAYEYQAVIMYIQYSSVVTGPHRSWLSEFFSSEVSSELSHSQYLAQKVAALGGVPITEPKAVPEATEPVEMLNNVLSAENDAINRYVEHAEFAGQLGEHALRLVLEDFIKDETTHKEETEKVLRGWK